MLTMHVHLHVMLAPPQIASLKALGLNIRRAKLKSEREHKFYLTDMRTSEKVGRCNSTA
jgi:hypothetical protein